MKTFSLLIIALLPFLAKASADSTELRRVDNIKKGWNLGPVPVVAYDSDLGFVYGAILNFFSYGDGTSYPQYKHSIYTEASWYTKGSAQYRIIYDSKYAIKGVRVMADVQYLTSLASEFFGFNGNESFYNKAWTEEGNPDYHSKLFYKMNKDNLRAGIDLQGNIKGTGFGWAVGTSIQKFDIGPLKMSRLNVPDSPYDAANVLYNRYVDWGLIKDWEKRGGTHISLKGAIIYDTRDNEPNPMKGIWADAILYYLSPNILAEGKGHLKLALAFRKYFTIIPEDLSFAFRIMSQNVIAGTTPFYLASQVISVSPRRPFFDGLGGAYSLRGMLRNRVVSDGFALANAEFRYKFWRLHLLKQNFYCAITTFADAGLVTQKHAVNLSAVPQAAYNDYFRSTSQKPHYTVGIGGKLVMNQNFVISGDIGKTLSSQDGDMGMYIGVNFLF